MSVFLWFYKIRGNLDQAETAAFLTICISELYRAFSSRSTIYPVFKVGILKNKYLVWAVLSSFLIAVSGLIIPSVGNLFNLVPLGLFDIAMLMAISTIGTAAIEVYKYFKSKNELNI